MIAPDEEQKEEFVPIHEGTPLEKEAGVVGMGAPDRREAWYKYKGWIHSGECS